MDEVERKLKELLNNLNLSQNRQDILNSYNTTIKANKLISLDLIGQGIKSLDPDSFENFPHLQKLFLSWNNISSLPSEVFNPLSNLVHLDLRGAGLEKISNSLFSNQMTLKRLELNDNNLDHLPGTIFNKLYSLEELNLSNNQLNYLHPEIFDSLIHLKRLYLYFNPLPSDLSHGDYYDRESVEEAIKILKRTMDQP